MTLATANLPSHSHALLVSTTAGTADTPTGNLLAAADAGCKLYRETAGTVALNGGEITPSNGGNLPHDNLQPYLAMYYIIATAGIWPSQN